MTPEEKTDRIMTAEDMIVELASDMVSTASDLAMEDYTALHAWLQPILVKHIWQITKGSEEAVRDLYVAQLGAAPDETTGQSERTREEERYGLD